MLKDRKKINLVGSKQTLLILLQSTNNAGDLWLLAKDCSAVDSPLSSLTTAYFSCAALPGPQLLFGPSVQLQQQSRTVKLHKAHQYYLCGKMGSYTLQTAGLHLHPQIKITCKQRPKLCLPHWWGSITPLTGLLWTYRAVNYLTGGSLNLVCQNFKFIFKYYLSSVAKKKELPWQSSFKPGLPGWYCRVNNLLKSKPTALLPEIIFLWLGLREHIASFAELFKSVATCSLKKIFT